MMFFLQFKSVILLNIKLIMWQTQNNQLYRKFEFQDFKSAFAFMTHVATLAEKQNHHPTWRNAYNVVEIWLCTHDAGYTITEKDWELAKGIDGVKEASFSTFHSKQSSEHIYSALFGVAVGDALGVPVEFTRRTDLEQNPVTDMRGFGTYNLPPGTWSDDSSLTFCLAEALCSGFDIDQIGETFVKWYYKDYWTASGHVFDIGIGTREALYRIKYGTKAELAGGTDEDANGNGSLMRILPLVFAIKDLPIEERFNRTKQVSSITHGHIRATMACFYYLEFAKLITEGKDKVDIYQNLQKSLPFFFAEMGIEPSEIVHFNRILIQDISVLKKDDIQSGGYVVHTLEASMWCLLSTEDYPSAVLKAVNLGRDTDTTAAVTGGLAGMLYGFNGIPKEWVDKLARMGDIEGLAKRFTTCTDD
jgi:ADP-ribosylglycohydrolase/pterin-4a-carbinolamine dehydratase